MNGKFYANQEQMAQQYMVIIWNELVKSFPTYSSKIDPVNPKSFETKTNYVIVKITLP